MVLPHIDLPTLLVATALGIAFSGVMLILSCWRDRSAPALAVWGMAMMLGGAGFVILLAQPLAAFWSVVLADSVLVFSAGLCWAGARIFTGRPAPVRSALAGPLLLFACASLSKASIAPHLVLTLVLVAGYTLATAWQLLRHHKEKLRSRRAAVALLVLHALFQLGRAALMVGAPEAVRANIYTVYAAVLLEALLFAIGMSSALQSMMKERAEQRSTGQLRHLTMVDDLTGLGNRRLFDEAIAREIQRAAVTGLPLALMMIDVDHFKLFNDTYGHQPGDDCLRGIAGAIQWVARRPGDVAARYGGEEFAVLLPGSDESGAMEVARRIHASIRALRIDHAGSPYGTLTVSIGVAALQPGAATACADELIRQADWALYVAKSEGRNITRAASESRDSVVLRQAG
jgi:diguanylate cyclase (GGDEF)-like protein